MTHTLISRFALKYPKTKYKKQQILLNQSIPFSNIQKVLGMTLTSQTAGIYAATSDLFMISGPLTLEFLVLLFTAQILNSAIKKGHD